MFSSSVATKRATAHITAMALAAGLTVATVSRADVVTESAPSASVAAPTVYGPSDGTDLLNVLQAPQSLDSAVLPGSAAPRVESDIASIKVAPQSLDAFETDPWSKRFEAWDLQGGAGVPEPVTALLFGAGLAALAVRRGFRGRAGTE